MYWTKIQEVIGKVFKRVSTHNLESIYSFCRSIISKVRKVNLKGILKSKMGIFKRALLLVHMMAAPKKSNSLLIEMGV